MNVMRDRVKEHYPMVLLTLLSIVQALALELLWSHVRDSDYLLEPSWTTMLAWVQILATFTGLVLIWVVYASNVMRLRWVPVTSDSIYPFVVGILQFTLVESLGADEIGRWLILMALIFAMMSWVSHANMRRARQDPDNADFFAAYKPARLRDFYPQITIVTGILLAGITISLTGDQGWLALLALLATNGVLIRQHFMAARFWKRTVVDLPDA